MDGMTSEESDARLSDALMAILGKGTHDVPAIVEGLIKAKLAPARVEKLDRGVVP